MIKGRITKIFVQKDDDWGIYNIEDIYARTFKAVGVIPNASVGMYVVIETKKEMTHWGEQETITAVLTTESDEYAGVRRFLSDGYVRGIKETMADRIIATYGPDTEKILKSDDVRAYLLQVKGIGPATVQMMIQSLPEALDYLPLLQLCKGSITRDQADRIMNRYGRKAVSVIKKNPYKLITEIKGFGFQKVDAIAAGCGIKKNSLQRIAAGISYTIDTASNGDGDCYLYRDDIRQRIGDILVRIPKLPDADISKQMVINALADWGGTGREKFIKSHKPSAETLDIVDGIFLQKKAISEGLDKALDIAIKDGDLIDDDGRIFTKDMYERERHIAYCIKNMLFEKPVRCVSDKAIEESIERIEKEKTKEAKKRGDNTEFRVTDEQKDAIKKSLSKRVSVITGGPGRGKTTIIQVIVDAFLNSGKFDKDAIMMLAPTGRAAQRIKEQTGFNASTIHRGIFTYENGKQKLNDPPKGKLIIVDESSMIDIYLCKSLIDYAEHCQIIFVGDVDQIASVGPGKVLKDLITSGVIPTSFLIKGHRNTGSIAKNAALINKGIKIADYEYDRHFVYIKSDAENIQRTVINDYIRETNEYGMRDVLLCVAMRERGPVCVNVLNARLQEIFTEGHAQVRAGKNIFRVGDRVMQTKNDYKFLIKRTSGLETGVFNGEKGTIIDIEYKYGEPQIVVSFDDGSYGGYTDKTAVNLTLAYATTVHKCQGSESPCVMMAYTFGDFMLLKRSLFYTGETRAKKEFRFYGEEQFKYGGMLSAFDIAVKKVDDKERNTCLAERIKESYEEGHVVITENRSRKGRTEDKTDDKKDDEREDNDLWASKKARANGVQMSFNF